MTGTEEIHCRRCGSSPATLYFCESGCAPDIALCDDCLSASSPWTQCQRADAPQGTVADQPAQPALTTCCAFCGDFRSAFVPDPLPPIGTGFGAAERRMCRSCAREYRAALRPKIRRLLESPPGANPMIAFLAIEAEMEAHMRRHVMLRKN